MDSRRRNESSPYDDSDPSSISPFSSFTMPTPAIVVQAPRSEIPEMPYGQPYASGPHPFESTFSSGRTYPPEYPDFEGTFGAPSYAPVSSERQIGAWVPSVPGLLDEEEVNPMSEPNFSPVPEPNTYPQISPLDAWVPAVPQSDEAGVDPTSEPISIYAPSNQETASVTQSQSTSRKPYLFKRFVSFFHTTRSK